jgi:hypothetical protein
MVCVLLWRGTELQFLMRGQEAAGIETPHRSFDLQEAALPFVGEGVRDEWKAVSYASRKLKIYIRCSDYTLICGDGSISYAKVMNYCKC